MCSDVEEECPAALGLRVDEHWDLPDPAGRDLPTVRAIRDAIRDRVADLVARLGVET